MGGSRWTITAVAPSFIAGDLRPIPLEAFSGEACALAPIRAYFTRRIHVMLYSPRLRELLRGPVDLVHCWEEPYLLAAFQVAAWSPRSLPFVFWTAQNLSKRYPPPFSWIERFCVDRCAGWLAAGTTVTETLLPRGYARRPHRIIPLGVDIESFRQDPASGAAVRRRVGWSDAGPPIVGYLGRFVPEKGLGILMEALDRVPRPWRALFVGAGPMESAVRKWAIPHGDRVRILTSVAHDEVPACLNAMQILCAPSQTTPVWREQLGRMLIEAFACGVPVIASDSGEIPHVVADAALVLPEGDVQAWAEAIGRMIDDSQARAALGEAGRARAHEVYAWPVIARQHLDFFEERIGTAGEPSLARER